MTGVSPVPFVVGEKGEAMSFQEGYRGAWYCCEIKEISSKKGEIGAVLKYIDYPDEKDTWLKLYQVGSGSSRKKIKQLMLRPKYPTLCKKDQIPDLDSVTDVMVVYDGIWKKGDLIDWFTTGCYWSGKITQIFSNGKAQIELTPRPLGEGGVYDVLMKELRPSLDWSVDLGWTVPISKNGNESRRCARLIQPVKQATQEEDLSSSDIKKINTPVTRSSGKTNIGKLEEPVMISKSESLSTKELTEAPQVIEKLSSLESLGKRKSSLSSLGKRKSSKSSSDEKKPKENEAPEITTIEQDLSCPLKNLNTCSDKNGAHSEEDVNVNVPLKNLKTCVDKNGVEEDVNMSDSSCSVKKVKIPLNTTYNDTFEAALLDLEELSDKVKWLKRILESGIPVVPNEAVRPSWKFIEHYGSSLYR